MDRIRLDRRTLLTKGLFGLWLAAITVAASSQTPVRPPAVPLVAHDPYFSVWSMNDKLTDNWSKHWTGSIQAMCGMAYIDKKAYRFAGPMPDSVPVMKQTGLSVTPTKTTYQFEEAGVKLTLTFLSPLLTDDLDLLSRPVTFVTFDTASADGKGHSVKLYFDTTGEWAVNTADQQVKWERESKDGLSSLRIGTVEQPVLAKRGDNLRIDWGYFYVSVPSASGVRQAVAGDRTSRGGFASSGTIPMADDTRQPRRASDDWPVLATVFDLGNVKSRASRHLLLSYDDLYAIELMGKQLKPYWRRNGLSFDEMLAESEKNYPSLQRRCTSFDRKLEADLIKLGGADYAKVCTLAYRQCLAAHKLVADENGKPLHFAKENFSNGCISTVDVIYPASPFFLLFSPELLKANLTPVLDYSTTTRWKFPFAPHDLGTYPKANGQVYGGGERDERDQMPVEETGNMLIMLAALARIEGNADYSKPYWPVLTRWAQYLKEKGLDPENQLCTDDFAGHLAHNTNLSLKAIIALGSYSQLCSLTGRKQEAADYRKAAQEMASKWLQMANDGNHYRLTFDKPGTWSQKYNLVWDKLLSLNLFPADLARTELAYYKTVQNPFGLPLDNRKSYTKLDWTVWTATMAESQSDFQAMVSPLNKFVNESPSRVPLSDWFETKDGRQVGFQARSVVGGVFIKMLSDMSTWKKWATHH